MRKKTFQQCLLEKIYIPATVRKIEQEAFSQALPLKKVRFGGTESQWKNYLEINETGNTSLIECTDIKYESKASELNLIL